jgi:hypothetical protein
MLADILFQHTLIRQPASWVQPCQTECFILVSCLTTLLAPQSTLRRVIGQQWARNWKGCGRKRCQCRLWSCPATCLKRPRKTRTKASGQPEVRSRFEPSTSLIHFRSITASVNLLCIRRGADKYSAFPICSTTKRIFLGWVKEVRTTKSKVCGAQRGGKKKR